MMVSMLRDHARVVERQRAAQSANIAASDAPPLDEATMTFLRAQRWSRA
jgi:hypothetical protein